MDVSLNQRSDFSQVKGLKYRQESGGQFILSQNYPNPFSAKTTIGFFLVESSKVLLDVFDAFGRNVVRLLDSHMGAGGHSIDWWRQSAVAKLPAGIYSYQLVVENSKGTFRQIKSMIVE